MSKALLKTKPRYPRNPKKSVTLNFAEKEKEYWRKVEEKDEKRREKEKERQEQKKQMMRYNAEVKAKDFAEKEKEYWRKVEEKDEKRREKEKEAYYKAMNESKALLKTKPRYPRNPKKSVTPLVLVSVDKAGDLKLGKRKCRLHKKDEVVKVAKKYGVPNAEKKTVQQLCGSIKAKAKASNDGMNNVPLAKLYPEAAKKRAAAKKVVTSFMKGMVTTNNNIAKLRQLNVNSPSPVKPKPSKKAQPITKEEGIKRIKMMKNLDRNVMSRLTNRIQRGTMSPRKVVKVARELSRLRAPASRVNL